MSSTKEATPGPYNYTETKTIKIAPIDISITTKTESSHVPPADCGCGGEGNLGAIMAVINDLMSRGASVHTAPPTGTDSTDDA